MLKNRKCLIITIVLGALLLAGIVLVSIKGFNYGLNFDDSISIQLDIEGNVEIKDIYSISKEVFKNKRIKIANINKSSDEILITVKNISDEEKSILVKKINEKYGTEIKEDGLYITNNYKAKLIDIIKPYLLPSIISLIIVVVFYGVLYRKNDIKELILYLVCAPVVAQLEYFSFLAVTRIPIGNYTMPISMLIYIISIVSLTMIYNSKNSSKPEKK